MHELGTECHLWIGARTGVCRKHDGRPEVKHEGKSVNPARLVCAEMHGPSDLDACHVPPCNNRMCINPDHLYWGTQLDNEADKRLMGGRTGYGNKARI